MSGVQSTRRQAGGTKRAMLLVGTLVAAVLPGFAAAEEPRGCDKFAWPIEQDRLAITNADRLSATNGASLDDIGKAVVLKLEAFDDAKLPMPPERAPKSAQSFAGYVRLPAVTAGHYQVTLSDAAWIDAIQAGGFSKPSAFSGVLGCDGARKSVRFNFEAAPLILQFSAVAHDEIVFTLRKLDQ